MFFFMKFEFFFFFFGNVSVNRIFFSFFLLKCIDSQFVSLKIFFLVFGWVFENAKKSFLIISFIVKWKKKKVLNLTIHQI